MKILQRNSVKAALIAALFSPGVLLGHGFVLFPALPAFFLQRDYLNLTSIVFTFLASAAWLQLRAETKLSLPRRQSPLRLLMKICAFIPITITLILFQLAPALGCTAVSGFSQHCKDAPSVESLFNGLGLLFPLSIVLLVVGSIILLSTRKKSEQPHG